MPDHTQANKSIGVSVDGVGDDDLLLRSFSGVEGISRLFSFRLDLLSEKSRDTISFPSIIGKSVTIRVNVSDDEKRYFNGYVSRFAEGGADDSFMQYQMEVVPYLWFLTRYADCRIFQNMTVKDIIQDVFQRRGLTDFKIQTVGSFPTEEYCVQYRETDFNFVSRLMEKYGIFYFFEHTEHSHKLILADSASAHPDVPTAGAMSYYVGGKDDEKVISAWQSEQQAHSGKHSLTDYNFTTPSTNLKQSETTVFTVGDNKKWDVYDYPGEYLESGVGKTLTKIRMEETEATHFVASGSGSCRGFNSGYKFELKDHPRAAANGSYVLTEVTHMANAGGYGSDAGSSTYNNHFTCIPASLDDKPITFRPPRVTPRPFVQGPQSALVVGKSGEEIWVDKYGRVRVQFYWDRVGANDEKSSCWVRVCQPWAGNGWGAMWIPRIGQEVMVSFEEGNPDHPLIIGRVYNAQQVVPYTLPDHQTVSTFRGNSSKGGGSNPNEIRFEDKAGSEQLFLNAKKDMDVQVINDAREFIGANRNLVVTTDQKELVQGNKHGHVKGDHMEKIEGSMSLQITNDQNERVAGAYSLDVGNGIEINGGPSIHLKAQKIILEADTEISLVVGGSFIDIGPAQLAIKGAMVLINSGGSAGSGGSPTKPTAPTDPDKADTGANFKKS
ncbi:MAG TPA: type VI secretion system tip protein TssI/VgrG [Candidatus Sulfotelmatobacter sp.]